MLIKLEDIRRYYKVGTEEVHALNGVSFAVDQGRVGGDHRPVRLGQEHPDERPRLPRHAHRRPVLAQRQGREPHVGQRAGRHPQPGDRLHLPDLPAAPAGDGAGRTSSCRSSTGACGSKERRERARDGAGPGGARQPDDTTGPTSCPAASGSAWPSPGRWSPSRRCCSPTSPPATSTRRPGEEIIGLFEQLHRAGHTLCLVTHEPTLAARCPRAIRISDGVIVKDGPGPEVALDGRAERARVAAGT